MKLALRLVVLATLISAAACASLPPSPIVAQSRAIDLQLGGN